MDRVTVTKFDNGPFVLKGEIELLDGQGKAFKVTDTVALCRCTKSSTQPFCDGTHNSCGFRESSRA
ncbi:CDGSH iron-sulfur domain-containing protein [Brevibacillus sp. SYSU BS000544]|uniref:CDGSH iron-sulfur domain-containing protein n=1 Tax=Brevibacillus sp. SYSU BS000544 TaxID=3416443 RepID=UPI003CE5B550